MNNNLGFTLLEALIVVLILSLAAMIGGLAISQTTDRAAVAKAEAQIIGAIASARSEARRSGSRRSVVFDLDERRFQIEGAQIWQTLPKGVELSITSARELGTSRHPAIAFLGDGTNSGADITLLGSGYARRLRVEWLTGEINDAIR